MLLLDAAAAGAGTATAAAASIVIAHAMGISKISITHKFYNNKILNYFIMILIKIFDHRHKLWRALCVYKTWQKLPDKAVDSL